MMADNDVLTARSAIANEIDRLIAYLDLIDGDPDLEPSLGTAYGQTWITQVDLEGDDCDLEPSLGSLDAQRSQERWSEGSFGADLESDDDCDDEDNGDLERDLAGAASDIEEDKADDEPSLGSFDRMVDQGKSYRQTSWHCGEDLELDRSDYEDGGDDEDCDEDWDGSDDEPSLGASELDENGSQTAWARGSHRLDVEDAGFAGRIGRREGHANPRS